MNLASNLRFAQRAASRNGIASIEALIRPALATRLANADNFLRFHSTMAVKTSPINGNGSGSSLLVEKPLKVLDSTAVERIKRELAEVDKNSDGRSTKTKTNCTAPSSQSSSTNNDNISTIIKIEM